ncbi:hypothetical protein [Streptomyces sp. NPDC094472]|uniref:hypothetical protein n=1 Tax=Streptomyces sp. NPDC094472 TaxID=3155080 RepID=UPI00331A3483
MLRRNHPHAPCVVTKVKKSDGTRDKLTTALSENKPEGVAEAIAEAQVSQRWPGAEVLSVKVHRTK